MSVLREAHLPTMQSQKGYNRIRVLFGATADKYNKYDVEGWMCWKYNIMYMYMYIYVGYVDYGAWCPGEFVCRWKLRMAFSVGILPDQIWIFVDCTGIWMEGFQYNTVITCVTEYIKYPVLMHTNLCPNCFFRFRWKKLLGGLYYSKLKDLIRRKNRI